MNRLFLSVLGLSLAGGLTCLVIFGATTLTRNRLPKTWLYYLWLVAVLRFALPFSPNLPFTLPELKLFSEYDPTSALESTYVKPFEKNDLLTLANTQGGDAGSPATVQADEPKTGWTFNREGIINGMAIIWLGGACTMFLWYIVGYIVTIVRLKRGGKLLISDLVPVYEIENISTPILFGLFRPAVFLPKGFENRDLALRHERCHLSRGDLWLKFISQMIVCIHWFNPAVYLMKRELNRLAELACDQAVINNLGDCERRSYGTMILDTAKSVSGYGGMMFFLSGTNKRFLRERVEMIVNNHKAMSKKAVITMIALAFCIIATATIAGAVVLGNTSDRTVDNVDLPFVDDSDVIGTWVSVDFVKNIADFDPTNKQWQAALYLQGMIYANDGELAVKVSGKREPVHSRKLTWTKGVVLNYNDKTASKYEIVDIDGERYMFFEWKSGDYTIRHMTPQYYVLKFLSSETDANKLIDTVPDTDTDTDRIVDNLDFPFIDDPDVIGTWESVDFVKEIADFTPGNINWQNKLYMKELTYTRDGELAIKVNGMDESVSSPMFTWTKGVVLNYNDKTASKYEIADIDGEKYMFFEWKSGDYIIRHMTPQYYVLKKID